MTIDSWLYTHVCSRCFYICRLAKQQYEAALRSFWRSALARPGHSSTFRMLGSVYTKLGRYDAAATALNKVRAAEQYM